MDASQQLAQRFANIAQRLAAEGMTTGLQQSVDVAVETIRGCDYAGITITQPGNKYFTPAATEGPAAKFDQLQYDLGEGPGLDTAKRDVVWVQSDDLSTETRWPRFCAEAHALGVTSVLSYELESPRGILGALNLYAQQPDAFDATSHENAAIYATHAAVALSDQRMQDSLRAAMDSRESIGIAMGILMERYKATRSHSFEMLAQVSQDTNTKLREVAESVALTGQDPGTP